MLLASTRPAQFPPRRSGVTARSETCRACYNGGFTQTIPPRASESSLMYLRMAKRLLLETDKRLLWKAMWNFGFKGMRAVQKHKARLRRGEFFPPFLYISVINSCNLRCQGCWVDVAAKQEKIEIEAMDRLIHEAKEMGNSFFGILGGEPFMHAEPAGYLPQPPGLLLSGLHQRAIHHRQGGRGIAPRAATSRRLISVEGNEIVSDERRGRLHVFSKTMQGLQNCLKHKVHDRRLHQPLPIQLRLADRKVGRSIDRDGRHVHLVPHLSPRRA